MPNPQAKLTDEEQYQVCQWYAQFKTPTQIKSLIQQEFGKALTLKTVWQYAHGNQMKKWKPMIERLRQEWALGVMDISLAHKRARLEELVGLYKRAERNMTVPEFSRIEQCYRILREMREEMEAGKSEFTNVYLTTIHQYPDEEVLKLREAVLARLRALEGKNGVRRNRQEATGITEVPLEADIVSRADGSGGGLDQRPERAGNDPDAAGASPSGQPGAAEV